MLRSELIIAGCILVFVGIALCIVGYNKIQPTTMDKTLDFVEQLSGEKAPAEFKTSKSEGQLFVALGALAFILGMGLIIGSRFSSTRQIRSD